MMASFFRRGFLRSLVIYLNPWALARWARFYRGVLKPGTLVFDVGAHVGNRALAMRRAGVRVLAIEPQHPFSTFLRRVMPRDIAVLDMAIGSQQSETTLAVSSRHPTVSTVSTSFVRAGATAAGFEHVRWDRRQKVHVQTLDALIAEYGAPAYIKIDVEGAETDVLAGLSTPIALISVEYLPALPHLTFALVDQLIMMGNTQFNIVRGEGGMFLWPDWRDGGAVKAWLSQQDRRAKSGDLFARRSDERFDKS